MTKEFFERNTSFAITINLLKTSKQRYVVFKPSISVSSIDREIIVNFIKEYELSTNISKVKRQGNNTNILFYLKIQNFDDIERILEQLKDYRFISERRRQTVESFSSVFRVIKIAGHVHKKWNLNFDNIIAAKLRLNEKTRTRKGFTEAQWKSKIQDHLQER